MHNTVLTSIALSLCLTLPAAAAVSYPLHDAVKAGKPSQVKATLDSSRVNQRNGADMTPLMVAAMYDRASSARSLLAAGARPDEATANYGTTALMMAAMNGYHEVVEVLVQNGADLNLRNKSGFTALMLAAQKGHAQVVRLLLLAGADPAVTDLSNRTAHAHAATDEIRALLTAAPAAPAAPKVGTARQNRPAPTGPVLEVVIPTTGKSLKFPQDLWNRVKAVNARLEKVLAPQDYGYLLACQLFWWQEKEIKRKSPDEFDGLTTEINTVPELVSRLEAIAEKPETIRYNTPSHWQKNETQGVREREFITDLTDEYVTADENIIVGLSINETNRYSFWDSRTGHLQNRLISYSGYPDVPTYTTDGHYWMYPVGEVEGPSVPFLGWYATQDLPMSAAELLNPLTGDVRLPMYDLLGLDDLSQFTSFTGEVATDVIHGEALTAWQRSGADYLGLGELKVWSSSSAGYAMMLFRTTPLFYAGGKNTGFTAVNANNLSFTVDLGNLTYRKTAHAGELPLISPAWLKPENYSQQAKDHPMLSTLSSEATELLATLKPVPYEVEGVDKSEYSSQPGQYSLACAGLPVTADDVAVYVMSNQAYMQEEIIQSWGQWVMFIRKGEQLFYAADGEKISEFSGTVHSQKPAEGQEALNYWRLAHILHVETNGQHADVMVNHFSNTRVYRIDFTTRKMQVLKEYPCGSPGNQRAFYVPGLRLLVQPVTAHRSELLRMDDAWNAEKVADLYMTRHGDYAVVLPNGHYAGSPGCEKLLEFAEGERVLGMDALAPWRNRPAEVLSALGGDSDSIAALHATTGRWLRRQGYHADSMPDEPGMNNFPVAEVALPPLNIEKETLEFDVTLRAAGRAITGLSVRADGAEIPQTWSADLLIPAGQSKTVTVQVPLATGQNWLEVTPVDSMGLVGDKQRFRTIHAGKYDSELYVVTLGVSDYADDGLDLQYAAKDARDLAEAFNKHGHGRVRTLTLTDSEVGDVGVLEKVRAFLAAATVHDRVVLYIAGHGMLDNKLDYYYAPHGFDPERIAETGISLEALVACLQSAAPRKRLLMMDTCHSGQLGEAGEEQLALAGMQLPHGVRAVQNRGMKVKKATTGLSTAQTKRYIEDMFSMGNTYRGVNIIAASAGAEFAMESDEWKNGVFCAAVCRSLDGSADYDKNGLTTIGELQNTIAHLVKELTGGRQNISTVALEDETVPLCGEPVKEEIITREDYQAEYEAQSAAEPAQTTTTPVGPLHQAVEDDDRFLMRSSLESGSPLEARDAQDRTPLMLAAVRNRVMATRTLAEAGANVNAASTQYGTTALMMAAMEGNAEVTTELLRLGANVNAVNKSGYTALILSARNGHEPVVRALLQAGANKTLRDSSGKSAADYATTPALKQLLQ
ncbi:MAG: ankyrin repeat domain-containing protein [Akkermansia sp.]|nr:ankyrin repeat domain-containing protein [Akkermansia sp.]